MINLRSLKTQLIIFLIAFALFLWLAQKEASFFFTALIALFFSVGLETVFLYFKKRSVSITESSLITGLIIAFVISSDNPWWVIALTSVFAILFKYLIRWNKRHLFNPAALGLLASILLFQATTQWRGTYVWYILLPCGIYFAYKTRKLALLTSYGLATLVLFGAQAIVQKTAISNIFGYVSFFFIFIMAIEPKTTPAKPLAHAVFGAGLALLIFIFTARGVGFDVELCSLLVMNATVPFLSKLR